MSRFNFTGLLAVAKALHETTTKHDTKAVIISDKVKNDTTIEFKNGSYIKVLVPKGECARGNRSKIIHPFYKERENNDIDGQILYVSSKGAKNNEEDTYII